MEEVLLKFESKDDYKQFMEILSESDNCEVDSENNIVNINKDDD